MDTRSEPIYLYVGTYTEHTSRHGRKSAGIYLYRLDPTSGDMTTISVAARTVNPSFLAVAHGGERLYAVNELSGEADPSGTVSAFAIDPATRALTLLNQQSTHGLAPCYVSVDRTGQCALVANYLGGNVCAYPLQPDGRLGKATAVVQHQGAGPHPNQDRPHAHAILPDPDNRFALALDLGTDKIMLYRLEPERGQLLPGDPPWATLPPGSGPRHLAFHPHGRWAFAINELNSTITAFGYDGARGTLDLVQTISTLPEGYSGETYCADIHVAPSGKFLYGSNRGHDSIAIFAIDQASGRLSLVGHEPTGGAWPRNFAIDPTGTWLLVANQHSDNIVTYRVDQETGRLRATGHVAEVANPVCITLLLEPSE